MRIVLVSQSYPPEGAGGIATQTRLKAQGLAARGHEVTVVACSPDDHPVHSHDGDVLVARIPGPDVRMPGASEAVRWLDWSASVAEVLGAIHAREPIDVVDVPEYGGEGYVHLINRSVGGPATVVHLHGPLVMLAETIGWPEAGSELLRVGARMEGESIRQADAVLSSSLCTAAWCVRRHGLDPEAVEVLHLGVDTTLFRPPEERLPGPPVIAYAGRLAASKGVDVLVDAAVRLAGRHPGLRLELHGRGDDGFVAGLRRAAAGHPGLLVLCGATDAAGLAEHLRGAHVFAAPSLYEGGPGLVHLEAMAAGLPVVGCTAGGVGEVVEHGVTGLLVEPGDLAALEAALDRLLADASLRDGMGGRGRAWVEREADTNECVRRLERAYEEAADRVAGVLG
jgi:glycosyltransferase involved in cell wall biosynthesis